MMPTDYMTAVEETAAFALLVNDPRKQPKLTSQPLAWTCTCCHQPVASPLTGCPCGGRCAPDFMDTM